MEAKVFVNFTDKITRKYYVPGDVYDGTPERVAELAAKGILRVEAPVPEITPDAPVKKTRKTKK